MNRLIAIAMLFGLAVAPLVRGEAPSTQPDKFAVDFAIASDRMGFELYSLMREKREGNLIFSPLSLSMTLCILAEGARGETAQQIGNVMRLPEDYRDRGNADRPWKMDRVMKGGSSLMKNLASHTTPEERKKLAEKKKELDQFQGSIFAPVDENAKTEAEIKRAKVLREELAVSKAHYELAIGNAIFPDRSVQIAVPFRKSIEQSLGADVIPVDFQNNPAQSKVTINQWISKQTQGQIKESPIRTGASTCLAIFNAVSFAGWWQSPFDEKLSEPVEFHTPKDVVKVVMMQDSSMAASFAAFNDDGTEFQMPRVPPKDDAPIRLQPDQQGFLVVDLPYGGGLSMTLIVPQGRTNLSRVESLLTAENFTKWKTALRDCSVDIQMPRFNGASTLTLNDVLTSAGMPRVFSSSNSGFSGMIENEKAEVLIEEIGQSASVSVNEQGAIAAAVTGAGFIFSSEAWKPRVRVDRPFLFVVRKNQPNVLLFIGRINKPE